MSIREALEGRPWVGIVLVVIAAGAVTLAVRSRNPRPVSNAIWFYDTGAKQLYPQPSTTVPPVTAPSGQEGVVAVVMSCGSCAKEAERYIAYLEKFSDDYRKAMAAGGEIPPAVMMNGTLWRPADGDQWVSSESSDGRAMRRAAEQKCTTGLPATCKP